ncbi:hypothetical protein LWI28_027748 [Acer negundo]|uniref:Uncharacterized protein n=1 Tax=Acer negundo TaxID=4023 RepID=A0AAD5IHH9_ACENE|nr:hypothetical protein LWI28_027748 [Acer negundo]
MADKYEGDLPKEISNFNARKVCRIIERNGSASDITAVEIPAISRACYLVVSRKELRGKNVVIVSDSKVGVSWINSAGVGNWKLLHELWASRVCWGLWLRLRLNSVQEKPMHSRICWLGKELREMGTCWNGT